jgi:hypothetical protein
MLPLLSGSHSSLFCINVDKAALVITDTDDFKNFDGSRHLYCGKVLKKLKCC